MGPLAIPASQPMPLAADALAHGDASLKGFERIVRLAARTLGVGFAGICVGDPARPAFIARVGSLAIAASDVAPCLELAARHPDPLLLGDAASDIRLRDCDAIRVAAMRLVLVCPLLDEGGERIGFLCALDDAPRALTLADREALDDLAGITMLALREWRKATLLNRAEQALLSLMKGFAADQQGDHLGLQAQFVAEVLGLDGVLIAEFADKDRTRLRTVSRFWGGGFQPELSFEVAGTPVEALLERGKTTWTAGVGRAFPAAAPILEGVEGCCLALLRDGAGEAYGVMMALSAGPVQDVALVEALLPVVAAGVEVRYKARRAAQELRMREAEIHAMFEHTSDLIFILDRDFRYVNVNPAYAAALGRPVPEILGERSGYYLPPHAVERAVETNCQIIKTGLPIAYDITLETTKGLRSFSVLKFPHVDLDGSIVGVIGIARDISERKLLERQKSEFVTALSHEIRTPLFAIQNAIRLMTDGCCAPDSEKGRRMLTIAVRNAERLVRLTHDVLSLEGLEAGAFPIEAEACDAASLLSEAAFYLEGLAEQAGVTLAIAAAPVTFEACPERVMQVLVNLVGNAIKFSPAGAQVNLEASCDKEEVLFAVRDQGCGIAGKDLYRVFDPFHQVEPASRRHGGIGLGLPISREIVQAHGGRIWVESEVGSGSAFYVALPVRTRLRLKETRPR